MSTLIRSLNALRQNALGPLSLRWGSSNNSKFTPLDTFVRRHIGPREHEIPEMLKVVGASSLEELGNAIVPSLIRLPKDLTNSEPRGEFELLKELKSIASKNVLKRSLIGLGYSDTVTPPVILRNLIENPAWYTPYTPYQAEIAQGRLESLINFQTMVQDLTALPMANASLLDEATAAAESMSMCYHISNGVKNFFIDSQTHPQFISVIKTRAEPLGINIIVGDYKTFDPAANPVCGVFLQYPNTNGTVEDYEGFTKKVHDNSGLVVVAADLLSLTMLRAPGEFGADIAVGNTQRFGVPLGFGGPHAAYMACKDEYKRKMPGRIIGLSRDSRGKRAYRIALQTREQHIRREKATSNICTSQALLANTAAMYAVYHGPKGLNDIAQRVHLYTATLAKGLEKLGFGVVGGQFFDTIKVDVSSKGADACVQSLENAGFNVRKFDSKYIGISLDEKSTIDEVKGLLKAISGQEKLSFCVRDLADSLSVSVEGVHARKSSYLTHPVFNTHHSEHEMLRYLYYLQNKDIGLTLSMIPLGSCTMKLNATSEMIPVTWPEFNNIHPFAPSHQTEGYKTLLSDLFARLAEVTGFDSISLQPNSGAQGEYAGLLVIRQYLIAKGQGHRHICLIPNNAHGTNPASAVMAGMKVVPVVCDAEGSIDIDDLRQKADKYKDDLAAFMVTYPSTHGVYESRIREAVDIIHANGGQVYMDGANLNAQVGLTSPGFIGADVCHLNLHKTFAIPHGGGGPGMGPIGVAKHLTPFLPTHPVIKTGTEQSIGPVSAAPFGSGSILPITWTYLMLMGGEGLKKATQVALLNANYMRKKLADHYPMLYSGPGGYCAHEFIMDIRPLKHTGIQAEDVAKRLQDYGFHAPTMSFPVPNTLMIEPTESEPKAELDRLVEALISIRQEIREIEEGRADPKNNVLVNSPHTCDVVVNDNWDRPYTREKAAFPLPWVKARKFWPSVGRIDNAYGDRNLICSCPPMEDY